MEWFAAITTAPRPKPTLQQSVDAMRDAGWEPLVSFDGREPSIDCQVRANRLDDGSWTNFRDTLADALNAEWTHAIVVQDDCLLCPGLRDWLQAQPQVNDDSIGVLSLWCCSVQHVGGLGFRHLPMEQLPNRSFGALAIVMQRRHVETLLTNPPAPQSSSKTDIHLGRFCKREKLFWSLPLTSFCRHLGDGNSSLGRISRNPTYRDTHAIVKRMECNGAFHWQAQGPQQTLVW